MRGGLLAALLCTALLAFSPAGASASATGDGGRSALVVFLAPGALRSGQSEDDAIETELSAIPTLSTGILSATQGTYNADQMLLDVTQGARVSYSAYNPAYPPSLASLTFGPTPSARVSHWTEVLRRANAAPQLLEPGLLAASVPGGAAYVAPHRAPGSAGVGAQIAIAKPATSPVTVDWALTANRSGKIAAVSFGPPSTLLDRIGGLRATHRLVVADLPPGADGYGDLRTLAASRPAGELLVAIQSAPDLPGHELLWSAFAGLPRLRGTGGTGGHTLTSQTTNQRGMIAAIDIGPTILDHLGMAVPADMRGKPVRLDGVFDGAGLRALKARLVVIDSRRLPALGLLVLTWALLLCIARLPIGRRDRPRRTAWVMRVGAIAMLWAPVAVLIPAALEPSRTVELTLIVAICFALGALTDLLVPWPRAPLVPAVVAVVALTFDALAGTQLLMRSLLGPSPAFGARFLRHRQRAEVRTCGARLRRGGGNAISRRAQPRCGADNGLRGHCACDRGGARRVSARASAA